MSTLVNPMSDLRLELRIKNKALCDVLDAEGGVGAFCKKHHLSRGAYAETSGYATLRLDPWLQRDMLTLSSVAKRLCEISGLDGLTLFPPAIYEAHIPRKITTNANSNVFLPLLSAPKEALMLPAPDDTDEALRESLRIGLKQAMESLTDRQRQVLVMRFGLDGNEPLTQEEIGVRLENPVSKTRVSQIEHAALCRLRHPGVSSRLAGYA